MASSGGVPFRAACLLARVPPRSPRCGRFASPVARFGTDKKREYRCGPTALIVFMAEDGTDETNLWGPAVSGPLAATEAPPFP